MKLIVVADKNGGIGYKGKLLASIPGDMKNFRAQTLGKTVIMGRATLESFPGGKPLPKRRNIVLSTTLAPGEGYEVCRNKTELLELVKDENPDELMVIGGGQIYELLLPECTEALITEIDGEYEADTKIPDIMHSPQWQRVSLSETHEENDTRYAFAVYRRIG